MTRPFEPVLAELTLRHEDASATLRCSTTGIDLITAVLPRRTIVAVTVNDLLLVALGSTW